jgi:non-canonical purine NTP pyrophosphatase (RdgB/HAM1 family)
MKLLFATGNDMKFALMQERLQELHNIELVSPKMLGVSIDIDENGKTAEENAIIKAKAYHELTGLPTIAEDSGLFINNFKPDEQPGLYVKRVNGREDLTEPEILAYYIAKLKERGGRSFAHYFTGVCIIDAEGNLYSDTIDETEFLLTTKESMRVNLKGGILDQISYDLDAEKYFNDRSEEEKEYHYKDLNTKYRKLVKSALGGETV